MPRPKSEITKAGKAVGLRLTQNEYEAYVKLGAGKWLRPFLREHYKYLIESNAAETAKNPNQNELDLV